MLSPSTAMRTSPFMRPQPYAAAQNAQLVNMYVEIVNAPCNSAGLGLQVSCISSVTMSSPFCPGHTIMPTVAFTSSGLGRRGALCTLGDGVYTAGCGVGARVGVLGFNRGLGHVVGGIFWSVHSGGTTRVGTVRATACAGVEPILGVSGSRSRGSARQCRACSNYVRLRRTQQPACSAVQYAPNTAPCVAFGSGRRVLPPATVHARLHTAGIWPHTTALNILNSRLPQARLQQHPFAPPGGEKSGKATS